MIYKFSTVSATSLEPVVKDTILPVEEKLSASNQIAVDPDTYGNEGELKFMGREFKEYWKQIQDNGDLTILGQKQVLKSCQAYIVQVAKSLHQQFPEAAIILSTCSFQCPRKHQIIDMQAAVERFDNNYFDFNAVKRGYHSYRKDDLLHYLYEEKYKEPCSGGEVTENVVGFWSDLYQNFPEYKDIAKLALLLMAITSDTCECERGFSVMNHVKNELRTAMTDTTLNACMTVGLEKRPVEDFPFHKLL